MSDLLYCRYCGRRDCFWRFEDVCQGRYESLVEQLRKAEEETLKLEKELRAMPSPSTAFESGWTSALIEVIVSLQKRGWNEAAIVIKQLKDRGPPK